MTFLHKLQESVISGSDGICTLAMIDGLLMVWYSVKLMIYRACIYVQYVVLLLILVAVVCVPN